MLKKKYYYSLKCWLLFEYGSLILEHAPSRTKTYDYDYEYPGDIITSSTMNDYVGDYDLDDLLESGIGWDEKWYTDTTYTTEVTTPYTVTGNATFYANLYKVIRFEVFDILTYNPIAVPASFMINGTGVTPISHPTYNDYTYVIKAPYESDSLTFNITVSASGYDTETFTYSLNSLDTGNILLSRSLDPNEFNINLHWDAPRHDFDSHLYIYSNDQEVAHLSYDSGLPSGYSGDAKDAIEYPTGLDPRNYYTLYYDDDTSEDYLPADHRENTSGKFISGLTYKFVVDDFDNHDTGNNDIKERNCIVSITIGGTTRRFQARNDITSGYEWEVFTIAETSQNVWAITLGSNTEEIS